MPIKIQSENVLKNFKEGFIGVNGANKKLKQALIGINGVNKELWKSVILTTLVWSLAAGTEGKKMAFDTSKRLYITNSAAGTFVRYNTSMVEDWTYSGMTGLRSIAIDASNNIYAHGYTDGYQVWKINSSKTRIWTHRQTALGESNPKELFVDGSGNSYIAWTTSSGAPYLYKTTSSGAKGWEVALTSGRYVYASRCDYMNSIYVTIENPTTNSNRLVKFNSSNGSKIWEYELPTAVVDINFMADNTDVYCAGFDGNVYVISTAGSLKKVIPVDLNEKFFKIVVASDGNLYLANNQNPKIIKTDSEGNIIFTLITGLTGSTRGLNVIDDYIYISDSAYKAGVINYMKFKEFTQ